MNVAECVLLAAVLLVPSFVAAQSAPDPTAQVERVEAAYENLDYDEAEALARSALAQHSVFSPSQLVRLHTTLALVHFARGEELEAADQFRSALTLNPNLTLDPLLVSPVTIAFFDDTKAAFIRERDGSTTPEATVRYVQVYDDRPAATWRSAVLPGWGQRYRGDPAKGWVLTGLWVATIGGAAAAHFQRQDAQDAYLNETDPGLVADRYDSYNTWHKARGGFLLGAAAVWVYAASDVLLGSRAESPTQVIATPAGFSVRIRF